MSSAGKRERLLYMSVPNGVTATTEQWLNGKSKLQPATPSSLQAGGKQITVSESHRKSRDGTYREGGSFFTSMVRSFISPAHCPWTYNSSQGKFYSGPIWGLGPSKKEMEELSYLNTEGSFGAKNEASMKSDGTVAISRSSPTNPVSDLGTAVAESFREGIPSLPGIQSWKHRTEILKGLGSEYLNYQFGWAPLVDEVSSVRDAARHHRDLLSQYHRGEGSDTHRTYSFPSQFSSASSGTSEPGNWNGLPWSYSGGHGTRRLTRIRSTKRWFEGCFSYALPSSNDNWQRALGYGSDADHLFGIALTPQVLWELTPWSWAVDWFTNAGEVINNLTNFAAAGLSMRYGYMMEESIERITASGDGPKVQQAVYTNNKAGTEPSWKYISEVPTGSWTCGVESVSKRRIPASPFGFSIGWEGLSPTQLAITAALGITRLR